MYWAGLGLWQIRRFRGSQDQYHTAIENIYSLRNTRSRSADSARRRGEGLDAIHEDAAITWHPKLPHAPMGFPEETGIHLLREEAQFIQDQIVTTHPKSLLARIILLPLPEVVVEPSSAIALAFVKARAAELEEPICAVLTGANIAREDHRRFSR